MNWSETCHGRRSSVALHATPPSSNSLRASLIKLIAGLYAEQLQIRYEEYLYLQCRHQAGIARRVDVFLRYSEHIRPGRILDWGCKHSVESCLIRYVFGPTVNIDGCDIGQNDFPAFHNYSRLAFRELKHPYKMDYKDDSFDVVIGSGVLEHVPNDNESLKELYRILKPGGVLIISFLPNSMSYTEKFLSFLGESTHLRFYSRRGIRNQLLHSGFNPLDIAYHQVAPSLSGLGSKKLGEKYLVRRLISFVYRFNGLLERFWPAKLFAANLLLVAKKVTHL